MTAEERDRYDHLIMMAIAAVLDEVKWMKRVRDFHGDGKEGRLERGVKDLMAAQRIRLDSRT